VTQNIDVLRFFCLNRVIVASADLQFSFITHWKEKCSIWKENLAFLATCNLGAFYFTFVKALSLADVSKKSEIYTEKRNWVLKLETKEFISNVYIFSYKFHFAQLFTTAQTVIAINFKLIGSK
jgi:hypothetical protein